MRLVKLVSGWSVFLAFVVFIFIGNTTGISVVQWDKENVKTDAIVIETMAQFGETLQRPPVIFLHDQHTIALSKQDKDCTTCHVKTEGRLSLAFKRADKRDGDVDKETVMEIYHDNCIGCHQEMLNTNNKTGPITCGECHSINPRTIPRQDPMGFDKSLHYRHRIASDNKCENCHHEYDPSIQKTVYVKGREGSCRYCHKTRDGITGMRFKTAAHMSCIGCHQEKINAGNEAGPVQCEGCHDPAIKMTIKKIDPVPRIERDQPDMLIVKRFDPDASVPVDDYRMKQVPFNHKLHEESQQTCRICHHEELTTCNACHSLTGSDKGNAVKLEKAMHEPDADMSCMGCHGKMTQRLQCRGCHFFMAGNQEKSEEGCNACHVIQWPVDSELKMRTMKPEAIKALLDSRLVGPRDIDADKIPETVIIKSLEHQYGPVKFPHGKIFQTLVKNTKDDRLAGYFHNGTRNMCRGCHHRSPLSDKPPRCGSCHGKPFSEGNRSVPGLMGAYHQQCMGCHAQMNMDKPVSTNCTACHEEKQKP